MRPCLMILAAASALVLTSAADAQNYPTRPLRIIVPFAAGGIGDITTRLIADRLGGKLGERVIVDNQPGAGGIAAARSVLAAPADGYTLALITNGTAINVPLFKSLPYDPVKDFAPISGFSLFDLTIVANANGPYATLGDMLKDARANPGKLNIGTINVGSTQNLAAELLRAMARIDVTIIPYRTTPDAMVAALRNDVQLVVEYYATTKAGIEDGKLRLLATTGEKRSKLTPNAPTVAEAGVPGYEVRSWNALFAKAGTSADIIARLNQAVRDVVALPEIKRRMFELGLEAQAGSPEEAAARLKDDIAKWAKVIDDAHIPKL
ncbi:MAG TPA: tripartite tricarboxylate transporter substrate binding protein [Xanthobacteraceae bacterium]|nr:tripartite tricarboxylate transporter substrate binding protein [Xanthobacteraceae bacterium]